MSFPSGNQVGGLPLVVNASGEKEGGPGGGRTPGLSPQDVQCCSIVECRMVVQISVYILLCVVVSLRPSNRSDSLFP